MSPRRRVPAPWALSIPVATFGLVAGFIIVTLPEILAAQNVPGGQIAESVAVIISPSFWAFLLSPFVDVRFRRRTYALVFGLPAATTFALLTSAMNLPIVYMEVVDGHGFDWHGVTGAFPADAAVSGGVGILLWIMLFRILRVQDMRRSRELEPAVRAP